MTAAEIISHFDLMPLPREGGFFKETYRSSSTLTRSDFNHGNQPRSLATAIFYLLTPDNFFALHRIKSDEVFHFYAGDSVEMLQIFTSNSEKKISLLGSDFGAGEMPQAVVPANTWQGLRLKQSGQWALLGTTVAPGFNFDDFELGHRDSLISQFPSFKNEITIFTRD